MFCLSVTTFFRIFNFRQFGHSHKKQHSLETCARLLFMLLQDFFASARLHRLHKKIFTEEYSTLFVPPKIK